MKIPKILFFLLILLSSSSCSGTDDSITTQDVDLTGTWELIEERTGGSPNTGWVTATYESLITFNSNGSFSSNRYGGCENGKYKIRDNSEILLIYDCPDFNIEGFDMSDSTLIERFIFQDRNLILSPTYLNCDEGCEFKFRKVE